MRKVILCLTLLSSLLFSGCDSGLKDGTYVGQFSEVWAEHEYSAKVNVVVKKGKIENVILDSSSNIATSKEIWTENTWDENQQKALDKYKGIAVKDLIKEKPVEVDSITGATLSSTRLYKAVINALTEASK